MGRYTREFEEAFAAFTGSRLAVACSSGTSALELIFRALEIEDRSIIVPTNTFSATALAVMHSGNRVAFADSDPDTLCLNFEDVERRITSDTAAITLVHIGGIITPRIRDFQRLCERKALLLVEDCAHAHGCTFAGQGAGTFGVAAAFSFFPTKVLTTGEGGMVTTDNEAIASRVRSLRNHGKEPALANHITYPGSNYRMSEITALLGLQQTQSAGEKIEERRRAAAFYDAALQGLAAMRPLKLPAELSSSYYKYIAYLDPAINRRQFKDTLRDDYGISLPSEVYAELCHEEPVWQKLREAAPQDFSGAEFLSRHHLCLPIYPGLTDAELEHVARSVKSALSRHATSSICVS
jgi:dTDP-4-amino-4,6-dideoxygalactose transaminase